MSKLALVVGGCGALGRHVTRRFGKSGTWGVCSYDLSASDTANKSVLMDKGQPWTRNVDALQSELHTWTEKHGGLDAIIHVAGGFEMGGVQDGPQPVENMWKVNTESAFTAAFLSSKLLKPNGTFVLTGAKVVFDGNASFAEGYAMSKAAVHQLAIDYYADTIDKTSQRMACILPTTIDTPANREGMPDADFSTWSDPEDIAEKIFLWSESNVNIETEANLPLPFVNV
mmetsp:Transcript_9132/g.14841  ORF Transcript_9132/g.14841 Transcript_9132/m.14841 type:complete len:228 (+) Transcript_9132:1136-1819(+)